MFAWWGRTVYRYRYIVIGVMVALCLGGGVFGISLGNHVTQSGFYDEGSQSVHASLIADKAYGRDTSGHIIAIYTGARGQDRRRSGIQEEDPGQPGPGREGPPRRDPAVDRLLQEPRRAEEHGGRGQAARVHVGPAQGRQRRRDPEQLQEGQGRPAQGRRRRRQRQAGRPATAGSRTHRHHRRGPEARRGGRHPTGRGRVVLRVRRRHRGQPCPRSSAA